MTDKSLFIATLAIPDPNAQAAYLDAACVGDPARRDRIRGLLEAHDQAGSFLCRPPGSGDPAEDATGTFGAPPEADPGGADVLSYLSPSERPGAVGRVGHYDVLEVLGRGGFGIVFRAFDDVLQRVVAIKMLAPALAATSPARKRFLREARSSAAVRHEHVVQVYAVEEAPLPHLIMEYIPGETLQARLNRAGPIDPPEVIRFSRQIAEGLAAAHDRGLIHRDVKPANVLIEPGTPDRAKLTDFGLARAVDDASLTQSGVVAGTPMYMSPEQARGELLGPRSDLFSLGSVLYVMCTGRPPFRAEGTLAVLKRVVDDTPRPVREVIPEVPEWLCRIIERLHAKDASARFQTAREVAAVLAEGERRMQSPGGPGGISSLLRPSIRPRRWRVAVAVGLLVAAAAGGVLGGPYAARYTAGQGVVGLAPDAGWLAVEARTDGSAEVTRYNVVGGQTLTLPAGRYTLEPECGPGRAFDRWEVTTHQLWGDQTVTMADRAATVDVPRGGRMTVRAVTRDAPQAKADPTTVPPSASPAKSREEVVADAFARYVAALPADDQLRVVEKELRDRNPEFTGTMRSEVKDGQVVIVDLNGAQGAKDLSPLGALRGLQTLYLPGGQDLDGLRGLRLRKLVCLSSVSGNDMSPLKGMPLEELVLWNWTGTNMSPLKGMPLRMLNIAGGWGKMDLAMMRDMPLEVLHLQFTDVEDLKPLAGLRLKQLFVSNTRVADLSPLREMPLELFYCNDARVTDLRPIAKAPLKTLKCDFVPMRDTAILRAVKTLETINDRPAAEVLGADDSRP